MILKVTIVALAVLSAQRYSSDLLKLTDNSTRVNDNSRLLGRVISAEYKYYITVDEILKDNLEVDMLSVSNNGHLLVGAYFVAVYNSDGSHVTTLNVSDSGPVYDAAWTPGGNIVCITEENVMVLSISGDILTESDKATGFSRVTVSQDGDIYVLDRRNVRISTDNGKTWSVRFNALDSNSYVKQAIKVSSDQYSDIFWMLEFKVSNISESNTTQLYMYTLHKTADNAVWSVIRSNVTIPTDIQQDVSTLHSITYDGQSTMFALGSYNDDVFMWSVDGTYNSRLRLMLDDFSSMLRVTWLAVDSDNQTMYAGLRTGPLVSVGVFTLTYESSS